MKTKSDVLVDAAWLDARLHDPAVRVVEVDVSRRAHDEWHIEGAVLWDVYRDLKDADYRLIGTAATMSLPPAPAARGVSVIVTSRIIGRPLRPAARGFVQSPSSPCSSKS